MGMEMRQPAQTKTNLLLLFMLIHFCFCSVFTRREKKKEVRAEMKTAGSTCSSLCFSGSTRQHGHHQIEHNHNISYPLTELVQPLFCLYIPEVFYMKMEDKVAACWTEEGGQKFMQKGKKEWKKNVVSWNKSHGKTKGGKKIWAPGKWWRSKNNVEKEEVKKTATSLAS